MIKFRFIVAEQNYLIRRGLIATLHELTNAEIVKEPNDIDSLRKSVQNQEFDFLLINADLCAKARTNNDIRKLLTLDKQIQIIGIVNQGDGGNVFGESGTVLCWSDTKSELIDKLSPLFASNTESSSALTQREKDIVRSISLGFTNKEVADRLFISPHTVITHRKNITRKLGIKSVSGLTVYSILNNLISVDEVND